MAFQPFTHLSNAIPYADRAPTAHMYSYGIKEAGHGLTARKVASILGIAACLAWHTYATVAGIRRGEFHAQASDPVDTALTAIDYTYAAVHGVMGAVQARLAATLFLDRSCPEPVVASRAPHPVLDTVTTMALEGAFVLTNPVIFT